MESNISLDHIALEAMKVILEKSANFKKSKLNGKVKFDLIDPSHIAKVAYDYAEAMIAERERRNNKED